MSLEDIFMLFRLQYIALSVPLGHNFQEKIGLMLIHGKISSTNWKKLTKV